MGASEIDSFSGKHRFLSNFYPATVELDGVRYQSVEHAYQAAKTLDLEARVPILTMTPGQAKSYGRTVKLRPDWELVKLDVMVGLLRQKFDPARNHELTEWLVATSPRELVEGNTWHDVLWGRCNCNYHKARGENWLGRLLMEVRAAALTAR
jgi:ribA/ribD-fused uncharacterized protein